MSRFAFDSVLDSDVVRKSEIEDLFADVSTWFNAPSLSEESIEAGSVEYRHVDRPLSVDLHAEYQTPNVTFSPGAFTGFYVILETVLTVNIGAVTSYSNMYESNRPFGHVKAKVHQSAGNVGNLTSIANYCIGYSIDNGVTWTPLVTKTYRVAGPVNGGAGYSTTKFVGAQLDYMTGAAGYYPVNYDYDKHIILLASLGGSNADVPGGVPFMVAVMCDSKTYKNGFIRGEIEGIIRWNEDTP